jgi:EAL domain-containing protein (putative c-di-GMP-specific phosphodiesterase class I)
MVFFIGKKTVICNDVINLIFFALTRCVKALVVFIRYFMFTGITTLTPFKKSLVFYYGIFSLFLSLLVFASGLYFYLIKDLNDQSKAAENALIHRMDEVFRELKHVVNDASLSCQKEDIGQLRHKVFYSPIFKEFGLFDDNFRVYCTNFGVNNFNIFSTIKDRIEQSEDHTTVSLVKSYILGEKAFIAFYLGKNGIGANGLAPPKSLSMDIDHLLLPDYPYELTIGKLALVSNELNTGSEILDQKNISLDDWAMTLKIILPSNVYWSKAMTLLPFGVVLWIVLWALSCALHWGFLYYFRSLPHCLRRAIRGNDMEVYYQPIVSLHDNKTHDMEALIRWCSPYHGQVSPLSIIEISGRLNLLGDLTWMVLRKVGQFYRENQKLLNNITTAVNVDRYCLLNDDFISTFTGILEEYPELKGRLGLEVTETSALSAIELPLMVSRFEHIKALDIRLSVDDFGTGYSGLDFLRRFPYDTLKLDRVFIASLKDDQFTQQVLTSITKLAKELNMKVVAEGVERKDQLDAVKELDIDSVQGYYFCAPLPYDQVLIWLVKNK